MEACCFGYDGAFITLHWCSLTVVWYVNTEKNQARMNQDADITNMREFRFEVLEVWSLYHQVFLPTTRRRQFHLGGVAILRSQPCGSCPPTGGITYPPSKSWGHPHFEKPCIASHLGRFCRLKGPTLPVGELQGLRYLTGGAQLKQPPLHLSFHFPFHFHVSSFAPSPLTTRQASDYQDT